MKLIRLSVSSRLQPRHERQRCFGGSMHRAVKVMIVSGSAKGEMRDTGQTSSLGPGGYAMMPSKHVHQFTCTSACAAFVSSDAAFDIHYVDAKGSEIPPETALSKKK